MVAVPIDYHAQLRQTRDTVVFLRKHSRLPGPRANLELVQAAADVGDERAFRQWIKAGSGQDPTDEFVAMCGVVGLGRLVAEGSDRLINDLQAHASDPRWRVREAVVLGLQRLGDRNMDALLRVADGWTGARPFVQRAAIAAVSEPRLLKTPAASKRAVDVIDRVMSAIPKASERRSEEFQVLRQALGYCWSIVVVANPQYGKPKLERWTSSADPDIRWIVRENLKKPRLVKMDPLWTKRLAKQTD